MPPILVIETGEGIANANCYGVAGNVAATLMAARQYALNRGVILSADDAILSAELVKATDYIESKASLFVGKPASINQSLSWPRTYVRRNAYDFFPSNELPITLLAALYQLCIEQENGAVLMPTTQPSGFVTRERIADLETQYSERIGTSGMPVMRQVEALLSTLYYSGGSLKAQRI